MVLLWNAVMAFRNIQLICYWNVEKSIRAVNYCFWPAKLDSRICTKASTDFSKIAFLLWGINVLKYLQSTSNQSSNPRTVNLKWCIHYLFDFVCLLKESWNLLNCIFLQENDHGFIAFVYCSSLKSQLSSPSPGPTLTPAPRTNTYIL